MEEKVSGIVLSGVNYGENDKILTIFTLEKGTISAKAKGVKKAGAKLKFCAEPFCFVEYVLSSTSKGNTVIGASLIDSFYPIREDLTKYYSASTVLEFLKRFEKESIVSSELFLLTIDTFKNLAYGNEAPLSLLVKFLLLALKNSGYALSLNGCFDCGRKEFNRIFFDYESGAFLCEDCLGEKNQTTREVNYATYQALQDAESGKELKDTQSVVSLRLIDYYLINKAQEKLNSLKELIKITA